MRQETHAREVERDVVAFWALTTFVVFLLVVPAEWIPAVEKMRPALLTSGLAAGMMLLRRIGKRESLSLDGARGIALISLGALSIVSVGWSVNPEVSRTSTIELIKLVG